MHDRAARYIFAGRKDTKDVSSAAQEFPVVAEWLAPVAFEMANQLDSRRRAQKHPAS